MDACSIRLDDGCDAERSTERSDKCQANRRATWASSRSRASHRLRPAPAARVIQARGDGQAAGRASILGGVLSQQIDVHDGRAESTEGLYTQTLMDHSI